MSPAHVLIVLAGYLIAVFGGGAVIQGFLQWLLHGKDLAAIQAFRDNGLARGGRTIGWLERFLVVTFFLLEAYTALGLVLAAKGIIRYGEIQDPKHQRVAEYILIGTMLSLAWALVVALGMKSALAHWS